ncbi:DUF1330 domain-containing protein [Rhodococcoides fascians]|uniref:DUF1330 domain-containing protein n=1 Tax=Rhodococcoides fascians TaxID=1828 RepID=UPI002ACD2EBA|nr:DUF1330 domain-containing protein [Rhodococcus fascians]WQH28802.1 DUF1330 domain-containing protein [Rhodococcus fascians]
MSYYAIANYTLLDAERHYGEYSPGAVPIIAKHGGEVLAAGETEALEEDKLQPIMVLLKFPSKEACQAFHDDPEYQSFKEIRRNETTTNSSFVGVPSYDG